MFTWNSFYDSDSDLCLWKSQSLKFVLGDEVQPDDSQEGSGQFHDTSLQDVLKNRMPRNFKTKSQLSETNQYNI